jgi:hypothetical protein
MQRLLRRSSTAALREDAALRRLRRLLTDTAAYGLEERGGTAKTRATENQELPAAAKQIR